MKHECDRCGKKFDHKNDWRRHKARKRPCKKVTKKRLLKNTPKFICPNCDKKYTRKFNLTRHLRSCGRDDMTKSEMEQVLEQLNSSEEYFSDSEREGYVYSDEEYNELSTLSKNESLLSKNERKLSKNESLGDWLNCEYCKKRISAKRNYNRHLKTCKEKIKYDMACVIEEQKKEIERLRQVKQEKEEIEKEYLDFMKKVALKGGNNITYNDNQKNMFFIMNNYTDAHNYESLMNPEVSNNEQRKITGGSVLAGVYNFIKDRCITGVDADKRPFHCVDNSRNKYLLYTQNKWRVDNNGEEILDRAINKVRTVFDTDIKRSDSMEVRDKKLKNIGELLDLEKDKKKLLRNINRLTLIKNSN